jgi:gas vesicle protein
MRRNGMPGTVLPFAVGLGVGAAVALLFAPKAGEDLRSDITEGVNDGVNQIRSTGKEIKRKVQRLARQVKPRTARRQRSDKQAVFPKLIKEAADESTHGQAHQGRSTLDQHG